jgi:hypothetical protein
MPRELTVSVDESRFMPQLPERPPDGLVDAQGMRILDESCKEQIERFPWSSDGGQVS